MKMGIRMGGGGRSVRFYYQVLIIRRGGGLTRTYHAKLTLKLVSF